MNSGIQTRFDGGKFCAACRKVFDVRDQAERCPSDGSQLTIIRKDPFRDSTLHSRFQILELLGCGGWAVVFKAKQVSLNRPVAVKMLHSHLLVRPDTGERFNREAALAGRLTHPNIVGTIDYGTLPSGIPYLIMEYLSGCNLDELLEKKGRFSIDEAYPILRQICDGLSAAHAQKIIHRDIKPSNIHIANFDTGAPIVKVMDFGLAKITEESGLTSSKLTMTGSTFGTPAYMSPELCKGDPVDERSDIYSLGCVMYELLTGHMPIDGCNAFEVMHRHLTVTPASFESHGVNVSPVVQAIAMKALAKKPSERFQSVSEFKDALDGCMAVESSPVSQSRSKLVERWPQLALWIFIFEFLAAVLRHRGRFPLEYKTVRGCCIFATEGVGQLIELFARRAGMDAWSKDEFAGRIDEVLSGPTTMAGDVPMSLVDFHPDALIESTAELFADGAAANGIGVSTRINQPAPCAVRGPAAIIRTIMLDLASAVFSLYTVDEMVVSVSSSHPENARVLVEFSLLFTNCTPLRAQAESVLSRFSSDPHPSLGSSLDGAAAVIMSRRLVEVIDGASRVDCGTDDSVKLSFQLALVCRTDARPSGEDPAILKGRRLLLVDSWTEAGRTIKQYAESWGMTCDLTNSVDKARATMQSSTPAYDVLVVDLPAGRPLSEFNAKIAENPAFATTPVVLVNANRRDHPQLSAINLSAQLRKPFKRSDLFNALCSTSLSASSAVNADNLTAQDTLVPPDSKKVGAQVLVVMDKESERKLTLLRLRILGLDVHAVAGIREAMDALAVAFYPVLVVAGTACGADPQDSLARIRSLSSTGSPVVILGMTDDHTAAKSDARSSGYDEWLSMSQSIDEMRKIL
ncbi:MAG TPA: serine/threonine-protein kinase, partial [Candidatus Obscuribacterales bacterium]